MAAGTDKFVDMVSAKVEVDLPLSSFQPRSSLRTAAHTEERPRFPAIDYHNHLDSVAADALLRVMDASEVEFLVNITMQTGDAALAQMDRLRTADAKRFATIGWMDWTGVERSDFAAVTCDRLERMVEHGAVGIKFWKDLGLVLKDEHGQLRRIDDERFAPIFDKAAELKLAVMFHTADPDAFFDPITPENERYERRIRTGVSQTYPSPSGSCWSSAIACLRGTPGRSSWARIWRSAVRIWRIFRSCWTRIRTCRSTLARGHRSWDGNRTARVRSF